MSILKLADAFKRQEIDKPTFISRMHEQHQLFFEYAEHMRGGNIEEILLKDGDVIMTLRSSGLRLYVDMRDHRNIPVEMFNFGDYERQELTLCLDILSGMNCLLDVGANVGWFSLECAARHPDLAVHSLEPLPTTYAQLERNIALNDTLHVTPYNLGLSDENGELTFYYYPEGLVNTSLKNLSGRDDVSTMKCDVVRLDDFASERDLTVDFIKADVEGAELHVIKGGLKTIESDRPVLQLELLRKWSAEFGYHPRDVVTLLQKYDYECFVPDGVRLATLDGAEAMETTASTNFFFLHRDKHALLRERLL